jgi:hypothetical protein
MQDTNSKKESRMTIDEIAARLTDRRLGTVSDETGLSTVTLRAIRDGKQKRPLHDTVVKLVAYFEAHK